MIETYLGGSHMISKASTRAALGFLLCVGSIVPIGAQPLIFTGRPTFKEGADRCYYVWKEGDEWHVRWTNNGKKKTFSGGVYAEGEIGRASCRERGRRW